MAYNRGSEAVYIDGTLKGVYSSYAPETRRQVARTWDNLSSGNHTIEVRVNGSGYSDIDAFAVDIATVGTGAYDNTHSQVRYFGTWTDSTYNVGTYNNSLKVSNISESGFRFTFSGDEITYLYSMHSNRGKATITIDGSNKGTIDQYSSDLRRQIGKTFSGLGSGVHVLTVTNSGTKNSASTDYYIDLDGLIVGNVYNRTAAVSYADTWAHGRNSNYPNIGTGSNCDDCTNFVSQVLEAGGLPQIGNPSLYNSNYYWFTYYILGWIGSNTWQVTSAPDIASFKSHIDLFPNRYQYIGNTSSAVETLAAGDFILMDFASNPHDGADHASAIVGWGLTQEPTNVESEIGLWRMLRNAHCNDRKHIRWDYDVNISPSNDKVWAYHVTY